MVRVAIVKGDSRRGNVAKALQLIEEDVKPVVAGKEALIKVNFVTTQRQLSATHPDAVRGLLDIIKPLARKVVIAEAPPAASAMEGYINYGYLDLAHKYGVELVDLNQDDWIEVELLDESLRAIQARVSRRVYESRCRISVTPLKTHDTVVATMSLKNMAVGSLIGLEKAKVHQGYPVTNINIFKLIERTKPHLSVIDGFEAMEGEGPLFGDPVDLRVAIASTDPLAADVVAAHVMGIDPSQIGYLHYAVKAGIGEGYLARIEIVGERLDDARRNFRLHYEIEKQLKWGLPKDLLRKIDPRLA